MGGTAIMAWVHPNVSKWAAAWASTHPEGATKVAHAALANAKALAARHKDTGAYIASLGVERELYKVVDGEAIYNTWVVADDPQARRIEYGHLSRNGNWVEGQYILTRATGGDR